MGIINQVLLLEKNCDTKVNQSFSWIVSLWSGKFNFSAKRCGWIEGLKLKPQLAISLTNVWTIHVYKISEL